LPALRLLVLPPTRLYPAASAAKKLHKRSVTFLWISICEIPENVLA
jgi:hypothetical protein